MSHNTSNKSRSQTNPISEAFHGRSNDVWPFLRNSYTYAEIEYEEPYQHARDGLGGRVNSWLDDQIREDALPFGAHSPSVKRKLKSSRTSEVSNSYQDSTNSSHSMRSSTASRSQGRRTSPGTHLVTTVYDIARKEDSKERRHKGKTQSDKIFESGNRSSSRYHKGSRRTNSNPSSKYDHTRPEIVEWPENLVFRYLET
jgi:hypothetical protein